MVDTLGLLLAVAVHPANVQDRDGARLVLQRLLGRHERLRLIWADGAYGGKLVEWARTVGGWSLELVRRPAQQRTFQVLPRRWVVERTFGWLNLQRRLSKDYEALCETTETWLYIAALCPWPGRAEATNWCGRVRVRMLMARRVVRTKTEQALVRIARSIAWSGSLTTASLVTPQSGRSRWGEWLQPVAPSGDTPTRQW